MRLLALCNSPKSLGGEHQSITTTPTVFGVYQGVVKALSSSTPYRGVWSGVEGILAARAGKRAASSAWVCEETIQCTAKEYNDYALEMQTTSHACKALDHYSPCNDY